MSESGDQFHMSDNLRTLQFLWFCRGQKLRFASFEDKVASLLLGGGKPH